MNHIISLRLLMPLLLLSDMGRAQPLMVSEDMHYLATRDGAPFFWLGDTGWELFHRLDRQEAELYIRNRSAKGFNVVQAVVLYELQAFESPNAYGDFPLVGEDIMRPDTTPGNDPGDPAAYDYWDHVEYIIETAAGQGIYTGLLPCWGEYITPRFRKETIKNIQQGYDYGWFIGNRYRHLNDHIVWILGGDRLPDERTNGC